MRLDTYELADRLDSFSQDYDFYEYMDYDTSINDIADMLQDPEQTQGIIDYLQEAIEDMDEMDDCFETASSLLVDLEEYQNFKFPSLEEKIRMAEQRQAMAAKGIDSYEYDDLEF